MADPVLETVEHDLADFDGETYVWTDGEGVDHAGMVGLTHKYAADGWTVQSIHPREKIVFVRAVP